MSCNIVEEYVSFSKKTIKKYLQNILGHYFDQDIYDDLIHAYIYTRYYNLYPVVDKRFEVNIVHYLKKALVGVKDDKRYQKKAKYMFSMFKYILYFDHVCECDSVRNLISEIASFRKTELEMEDDQFEVTFYHQLIPCLVFYSPFSNTSIMKLKKLQSQSLLKRKMSWVSWQKLLMTISKKHKKA